MKTVLSIGSICALGTWIGCGGIEGACTGGICARGASVRGVEPRALVGSGVNDRSREGTV